MCVCVCVLRSHCSSKHSGQYARVPFLKATVCLHLPHSIREYSPAVARKRSTIPQPCCVCFAEKSSAGPSSVQDYSRDFAAKLLFSRFYVELLAALRMPAVATCGESGSSRRSVAFLSFLPKKKEGSQPPQKAGFPPTSCSFK